MKTVSEIITQYDKHCTWCDSFWQKVRKEYPASITCHAGCSICCELQSVNLLETFLIYQHLYNSSSSVSPNIIINSGTNCPFLYENKCQIYAHRPLICRTHGLVLKSREFVSGDYSITCPYNFYNVEGDLKEETIFDIDTITANTTRFNIDMCLLFNVKHLSSKRFLLMDIAVNKLPNELQSLFAKYNE
jgi:Fe-S-cluster containining protein